MKNLFLALFFLFLWVNALGQELYTARGYWEEQNKEAYQKIKQKQARGDTLTANEATYIQDFEAYLSNYYQRLSSEERQTFERMKEQWDREIASPKAKPAEQSPESEDFDWRGRDRFVNGFYGAFYGASIAIVVSAQDEVAAAIPLLTTGAWLLGPAVNSKKFEGINRSVIRAGNSGRFLGMLNGAFLGMVVGGNGEEPEKAIFGLSALSSIVMGEMAFHAQKKHNYAEGKIEMIRHYGVITPWLAASAVLATQSEDVTAYGAAMLAGGVAGILIGSKVSNRYAYTRGDVDAISSLSVMTTGVGFTLVINTLENSADEYSGLFLIPALGTVAGSLWGQRAVRNVHLTTRQGNTIGLASGGAALIGLGILALAQTDSPTALVGIPTAFGLVTHQILFHKYKAANLGAEVTGSLGRRDPLRVSLKLNPESYFINKRIPVERFTPETYTHLINPMAKIRLTF